MRADPFSLPQSAKPAISRHRPPARWRPWALSAAAVAATTGLNLLLSTWTGHMAAAVIYLATICLLGLATDRWPVMAATLASALLWNFLFIPPRFTLMVSRIEDIMMFCLYFFLALLTGWAGSRLRSAAGSLAAREKRLAVLHAAASALAGANGIEACARTGLKFLADATGKTPFLLRRLDNGQADWDAPLGDLPDLDETDRRAARICLEHGQVAGRFTSDVAESTCHFLPLAAGQGSLGLIGVPFIGTNSLDQDQREYLSTLCRTISIAMEREILAEKMRRHQLSHESERLSAILLNSISHELRSPLTVIKGSASALADPDTASHAAVRAELIDSILQGTDRLNGIVENLLSMNRLEAGHLKLKLGDFDPLELIIAAQEKCHGILDERQVQVIPDPDCPPVHCDEVLIIQVLANLLDNARRHGGAPVRVDVSYQVRGDKVHFEVADTGPGMDTECQDRLFTKFFRGKAAGPGGTGIGLSICKGIINAHGGQISAANQPGQGFRVIFDLPAGDRSRGML